MKHLLPVLLATALLAGCAAPSGNVPEAAPERISHIEPPCWWTGMNTPLQLMVNAPEIGSYDVSVAGCKGVKVAAVHKAESPNYLFIDVDIKPNAAPGTCSLVFSKEGDSFSVPYEIGKKSTEARSSFSTADAIYLIMPDRFSNGDAANDNTDDTIEKADCEAFFGRHGGDLQGIINHLDYIADLGMTAIWLTPALEDNVARETYHGYACTDYYRIDPRIGSNELYRTFVQECHKRGLKVIMDIVTNHSGNTYWWMQDLPFADWVHQWPEYTHTNCAFSMQNDPYASQADRYNMESGWFDTAMVDNNLDNPYMLQYLKQWTAWWVEWAGLDGLRVDTYPYNEKLPMAQWCKAVREEYPWINIVGEVWSTNVAQVAYWQEGHPNPDGFDSHLPSIMDFCLHSAICSGINTDYENWDNGITRVYDSMSNDFYFSNPQNIMIFPGNHDTDRIGDIVGQDPAKMKIVYTLMATLRGFPQIFAGDELMCVSRDRSQGHGGLRVEFPDEWASDPVKAELHDYFRTLFQWRKNSCAVQKGKTLHFLTRDNTYAYFRQYEDETVFVFVNNNPIGWTIPWGDYSETNGGLGTGRNVLTGETVDFSAPVTVEGRGTLVVEFRANASK